MRWFENKHSHFPALYNRTFDVISEVKYILPRIKQRIEISALYPNADIISEVNGCDKALSKEETQKQLIKDI